MYRNWPEKRGAEKAGLTDWPQRCANGYNRPMKLCRRLSPAIISASLLLAACGGDGAGDAAGQATEADRIDCALAGKKEFKRACTTETMPGEKGRMLVIRHPDGGFRRFNILTDGRGLAPADGFDETSIRILGGGMIELASGDDIYRLPADIKSSGQK